MRAGQVASTNLQLVKWGERADDSCLFKRYANNLLIKIFPAAAGIIAIIRLGASPGVRCKFTSPAAAAPVPWSSFNYVPGWRWRNESEIIAQGNAKARNRSSTVPERIQRQEAITQRVDGGGEWRGAGISRAIIIRTLVQCTGCILLVDSLQRFGPKGN